MAGSPDATVDAPASPTAPPSGTGRPDKATVRAATTTFTYADAAPEYFERGWHPLPLFGGKGVTPVGTTGYAGALVTAVAVARWSKNPNVTGLCLRLVDMVGLDVDAYKPNCEWESAAEKLGPLPKTWISSSRFGDDYDGVSGIRIYRLPAAYLTRQREQCWRGRLGDGIDIVRLGHRQVNAWPQVHPGRGVTYQWLNEETGEIVDGPIPCRPEKIPELPEAWAEAMIKAKHPQTVKRQHFGDGSKRTALSRATPEQRVEVESWWTPGEPCPAVRRAVDDILDRLQSNRHDTAVPSMVRLTRLGEQGHQGVLQAMGGLRDAFIEEREGDEYLSEPPEDEWSRAEAGIYAQIADNGFTAPENVGCCGSHSLAATDDLVAAAADVEWPEITELIAGTLETFPVDALPAEMAAAVHEVADAVIVDPAISAQAALGVTAGLLGAFTEVVINETWRPHANLWFTTVAGSTDGKSPGSSPFWQPLSEREAALKDEADEARRHAEVMLPILQAQMKVLQKEKTGAALAEMLVLQGQIEELEQAMKRVARVFVDDTTPERMLAIMAENGGVITAVNDEGSLFAHLDGMYSKTPNTGAVLKSWEGSTAKVDRVGGNGTPGAELTIERPLLTLIAAVQPHVVVKLGQSTKGHEERGLLGRVLWAWPQSKAGTRMMTGHKPPPYKKLPAWNARLLALADGAEKTVVMDAEAGAMFESWHDVIEAGLRPGGVYDEVGTFAPKIRESVARLAGLFARVDGATTVTAEHVSRAIMLGDYYLANALALVESWASGPSGVARKLLAKITANTLHGFTVRDAQRMAKVKADDTIEALEVLEAHGYVLPADPEVRFGTSGRTVGKGSPVVLVNPALWQ